MMQSVSKLPETMKALVLTGKERMRVEDIPVPAPGAGEALVKIGAVGVCGSDKHFYFDGRCGSEIVAGRTILGHEFGGAIVAVGPGVDAGRVGERVSVDPLMPCGTCRQCRIGRYNICPRQKFFGVPGTFGAMQQYLVVPARQAHAVSDAVSDNAAAMVETISVALAGVQKGRVGLGTSVLITGGGPVGLFAVQAARASGAVDIALVEPQPARRAIAAGFGAATFGKLSDVPERFDVLLECSGAEEARLEGCGRVVSGGRAVLIGVGREVAGIPMAAVIEREVAVYGVMRYQFTWPTVIAALENGMLCADALVTRTLPLSEAMKAWTEPVADEIKTMILMNG